MSKPVVRDTLAAHIEAMESIMASDALPRVRAILESQRDFSRDLGTHGLGVMAGKPEDDAQRVRYREIERCLTLLLGVLEVGK